MVQAPRKFCEHDLLPGRALDTLWFGMPAPLVLSSVPATPSKNAHMLETTTRRVVCARMCMLLWQDGPTHSRLTLFSDGELFVEPGTR